MGNGGWEGEQQLQEQFLSRKGFAFNSDAPGQLEQSTDMFKSALKTVDCTFQNLDSSEISLTSILSVHVPPRGCGASGSWKARDSVSGLGHGLGLRPCPLHVHLAWTSPGYLTAIYFRK